MTIEPGGVGDEMDPGPMRYSVLSLKTIWWTSALVVTVGVGLAIWLLFAYGHGDAKERNQLEAIKTAGAIVAVAGGAAALFLAARRQRTAEIALKQKDRDQCDVARAYALQERVALETRAHQERVAAATEADALERWVTELYTKAADQLGSDKAPVRLAGLYALERLAQANLSQRQTVVKVLCAYLRMPCQPPEPEPASGEHPADAAGDDSAGEAGSAAHHRGADGERRMQEREVRLTAQQILRNHLRPGDDPATPAATFWPGSELNLTGAHLIDLDLANCRVGTATFAGAQFAGSFTRFDGAQFTGDTARFSGAQFTAGLTSFSGAQFTDSITWFDKTQFTGSITWFGRAQFAGSIIRFDEARFTGDILFYRTRFTGDTTTFGRAQFTGETTSFDEARFTGDTTFGEAQFTGDTTTFDGTQFSQIPDFELARVRGSTAAAMSGPPGWMFEEDPKSQDAESWLRMVRRPDGAEPDDTESAAAEPSAAELEDDSAAPQSGRPGSQ